MFEEIKDEMKTYTTSHDVEAVPMKLGLYNEMRGWTMPTDEDPDADGYLVLKPYGDEKHSTWVPKKVFESTFQEKSVKPIPVCKRINDLTDENRFSFLDLILSSTEMVDKEIKLLKSLIQNFEDEHLDKISSLLNEVTELYLEREKHLLEKSNTPTGQA